MSQIPSWSPDLAQRAVHCGGTRRFRIVVALVVAIGLLLSPALVPTPSEAAEWRKVPIKKIHAKSWGLHTFQGKPEVDSGAVRTACLGQWRQIQPERGVWHWDALDADVALLESYGYKHILYTFCDVPDWASRAFGEPANLADWRTFVTAVVTRYKGRFDAYEVFNEATSRFWYQGTPRRMAQMTKDVHDVIKRIDKKAKVVSASVQIHRSDWLEKFLPPYLKHLKKLNWPIDSMAFHTYTLTSPFARAGTIKAALKMYRKASPPKRIQLWDTEVNYPNKSAARNSAALVARTFIDSWRNGFSRVFWYMWTRKPDSFLGVELMPGSVGTAAYRKFYGWTATSSIKGCKETGLLVFCRFSKGASKFTLVYAKAKKTRVKLSAAKRICPVSDVKCVKKRKYQVTKVPVRVTGHPGIRKS